MLYMALRYPGGAGADEDTAPLSLSDAPEMAAHRMGRLTDLLRWHAADPVDAAELRRNGVVAAADLQANRNPFVDVPALAGLLFGGGQGGGDAVIARLRGLRPLQRERQCDGGGGGGAVLMRDIEAAASAEEVQSQSEAARAGAGGAFCFCLQLVGGDGGGSGGGGGGGGSADGAIVDAAAVAAAVAQQRLLCGSSGGVAAYRGVDAGLWAGLVAEARTAQRERVCFCS